MLFDLITESHDRKVETEATDVTNLIVKEAGFLVVEFADGSYMVINGNLFRTVTISPKEK